MMEIQLNAKNLKASLRKIFWIFFSAYAFIFSVCRFNGLNIQAKSNEL